MPSTYVWNAPTRPLAIHLSLDAVRRLSRESRQAAQSAHHPGLEIGGLLPGRIRTENGFTTIFIDSFEPVYSEHSSGPAYLLSEPDLRRLDRAATEYSELAGLFRTHTRREVLTLAHEDVALLRRILPGPNAVFLLVRPVSATAAFFVWHEGSLALRHEFPFDATELGGSPEEEDEPLTAAPMGVNAGVAAKPPLFRRTPWLPAVAATLLGFVLGAALWLGFHNSGRSPRAVPATITRANTNPAVRLRAEAKDGAVHLFWDDGAEPIRSANRAKLWITDGNHVSKLDLDGRELRVGTLTYWPETTDVNFRLDLLAGTKVAASGTVRLMNGQPPPGPSESLQVADLPRQHRPESSADREAAAARKLPESQRRNPPAPIGVAARETTEPAKPSPFNLPPPAKAAPSPEPAVAVPDPPGRLPEALSPPPVPRQPAASYVAVSAQPVTSSFLGRMVRRIPLVRRVKKKPETFVPPKPIRQVVPTLTAREQQLLREGDIPVQVRVFVTNSGKVEYAELVSRHSSRNAPFATAAVYAARRWSFVPARVGAERVPGEVILRFDFRAPAAEGR